MTIDELAVRTGVAMLQRAEQLKQGTPDEQAEAERLIDKSIEILALLDAEDDTDE